MRKLITILLLTVSTGAFAQWVNTGTANLQRQPTVKGYMYRNNMGALGFVEWYTKSQVDSVALIGGQITGFTVSSIPTIGQVITTGTPDNVIKQMFAQTQAPTAGLSGGTVYELRTTSVTHNLNWSYGRQAATATIATAAITPGPLNVFTTQPAQSGSVSGTQSVTSAANVDKTYTLTVTTSDSKTATASTTDSFLPNVYWGRTASSSPSSATIIGTAGGGANLQNSKSRTFNVTASGSNFIYFAYPSSLGALTSITIGGFESIGVFTASTVSVTNASSYVQNYTVYVSNNTFSGDANTIITQ